eukprot:TRINITY_DN545_c0_g1_i2.p1 TRINITY_DN545_c0_g1~~TRINITY_DN545_c0_g1_i2.p1  ORF type:complete len:494 (-),score=73.98 TRINITY_DN545_c0_g1_i2:441-1922(-)
MSIESSKLRCCAAVGMGFRLFFFSNFRRSGTCKATIIQQWYAPRRITQEVNSQLFVRNLRTTLFPSASFILCFIHTPQALHALLMPNLQTTIAPESTERENSSSPSDRRASIERFLAVKQTLVEGLASIRSHVTSTPMPSKTSHIVEQPSVERDTSFVSPPRENSPSATQAVSSVHPDGGYHITRLSTLLEASEARAEAAQHEAERLRKENDALRQSADRAARLLEGVRADYDRVIEERNKKTSKEEEALADAARLRSELVEMERQLQQVSQRAAQAEQALAEKKQKSQALERVCMGLRRRVAVSEEKALDATRLQEALLARDTAESRLAETRAEAERLRAKCGATDVLRERADAAERSERSLRDRLIALEKEVESREALLRQGLLEKRRLKEYIARYERQLEEKDLKIARLRRVSKRSRHAIRTPISDDEISLQTNSISLDKGDTPLDELDDRQLEVRSSRCMFISDLSRLPTTNSSFHCRKPGLGKTVKTL